MSNILVTGGNGQLGSELKDVSARYPNDTFIFTDVAELDICNHNTVKEFIIKKEINIIINCAAYTAVDKAEEEFELSNKINHLAVKNFASIAKEYNIKLIHVSTDYVFDGTNHVPYQETDEPNPQSVYGVTKLAGENAIQEINPSNTVIIRTSWVYSSYGNNFVKTMLRLGGERSQLNVVGDQVGGPTSASSIARSAVTLIEALLKGAAGGTFHFAGIPDVSWAEFAGTIMDLAGLSCEIAPILSADYPMGSPRPLNSRMDGSALLEAYGIPRGDWAKDLEHVLTELAEKSDAT